MTLNPISIGEAFARPALTFDSIPADALLTRSQAAKALTDCGVPTAEQTFQTKASRGGGPLYRLYGKVAIYRWGDVVAWVLESMGEPASSATERRATSGAPSSQKPSPEKLAAMVDGSRRYNAARVAARRKAGAPSRGSPRGMTESPG